MATGLSKLPGRLARRREMVSRVALGKTNAEQELATYRPYAIPGASRDPRLPFRPGRSNVSGSRRPHWRFARTTIAYGPQFPILCFCNIRFLLAGDIAGARAPFWWHFCPDRHCDLTLNMAVIENATIAATYSERFRGPAAHVAR